MKRLLVVVVLLVAGIVGLGFYRGWFRFSTDNTDPNVNATITVDQDKIQADKEKAEEKVQDLGKK
jgi:predicted negative regulator of RcsB-dependent stress response